ncbi:MAG: GTP cyclohydrolase II [Myxococcota bacterium]
MVRYAESEIPTARGPLRAVVYREVVDGEVDSNKEHVALVVGKLEASSVLSRVHSECITSEVFGSLKCDCADQFETAIGACYEEGQGVVLYLRQEGRGIGLGNKIKAYALQAKGADTVQANHQLGFETDLRTYDIAAAMFDDLGVSSVRLLTNNPDKVQQLETHGVQVEARVPLQTPVNIHSRKYIATKRDKCGHMITPVEG